MMITVTEKSRRNNDDSKLLAAVERSLVNDLTPKQKEAVQLVSAGFTNTTIAETLGICNKTVIAWKRDPVFRHELAKTIDIDVELHNYAVKALYGKSIEVVNNLLESKNEQIRIQAAKLAFDAQANILRIAEETEMMKALEERMDRLAAGGIIPPAEDDIEDAEIIEESDQQ